MDRTPIIMTSSVINSSFVYVMSRNKLPAIQWRSNTVTLRTTVMLTINTNLAIDGYILQETVDSPILQFLPVQLHTQLDAAHTWQAYQEATLVSSGAGIHKMQDAITTYMVCS